MSRSLKNKIEPRVHRDYEQVCNYVYNLIRMRAWDQVIDQVEFNIWDHVEFQVANHLLSLRLLLWDHEHE